MFNFEDQVKAIMQESAQDVQTQVKEQIKKQIIDGLTWNLREEVAKIVKETIETDMKEEIKAIIIEQQPLILDELRNALAKISAQIGNQLVEKATSNLAHSWNASKVFEAVFK